MDDPEERAEQEAAQAASEASEAAGEAAEAAEEAADAAAGAIMAAGALEAANERAEAAEETAEHIAEAALEGERGRRIEELERGLEECRTKIASLPAEMQQVMEAGMTELVNSLSVANGDALQTLKEQLARLEGAAGLTSSTPPQLETPPETEVTVIAGEEAEAVPPEENEGAREVPRKRKRFL